jgi:hypothetical protein
MTFPSVSPNCSKSTGFGRWASKPAAASAFAWHRDLEGIAAKWTQGTLSRRGATSWVKVKNPDYSQAEDRHELFEKRRPKADQARWTRPELAM